MEVNPFEQIYRELCSLVDHVLPDGWAELLQSFEDNSGSNLLLINSVLEFALEEKS